MWDPNITTNTGTLFLKIKTSRCAQGNKLAQNNSTWWIFVNTNDELSSGSLVAEFLQPIIDDSRNGLQGSAVAA